MTVAELLERLRQLEPGLHWPVAIDLNHEQLVPVIGVAIYDVPALVFDYDEDGAIETPIPKQGD